MYVNLVLKTESSQPLNPALNQSDPVSLLLCSDYTDLSMSTVTQTLAIPYTGPISLLVSQLRSLAGESTPTHLDSGLFIVSYLCLLSFCFKPLKFMM